MNGRRPPAGTSRPTSDAGSSKKIPTLTPSAAPSGGRFLSTLSIQIRRGISITTSRRRWGALIQMITAASYAHAATSRS